MNSKNVAPTGSVDSPIQKRQNNAKTLETETPRYFCEKRNGVNNYKIGGESNNPVDEQTNFCTESQPLM